MTNEIHDTSIPVSVFPDEFIPLLKIINCAILMPEKFALTDDELYRIFSFKEDFAELALEHGV